MFKFLRCLIVVPVLWLMSVSSVAQPPPLGKITIADPTVSSVYASGDPIYVDSSWTNVAVGTTIYLSVTKFVNGKSSLVYSSSTTPIQQQNGSLLWSSFTLPAGLYSVKVYSDDPFTSIDAVTFGVIDEDDGDSPEGDRR